MLSIVLFAVIGLVSCQPQQPPHGHDLHVILDNVFLRLDLDHDGTVTHTEFNAIETGNDINGDGCATIEEYAEHNKLWMPADWVPKFYSHYDHDSDHCLTMADMAREFNIVDSNNNGVLTMAEFEKYYSHLTSTLLGHGK